jgi:DNA-binding NarL/FixJ family response regulator
MVRIVITAPTLAVRAGLRALLASEGKMEVIAEASRLSDLNPVPPNTDVFVLAAGGFEAAGLRHALSSAEAAGVLLLIEEDLTGVQSLANLPARAWGVLPLDSSVEELQAAIAAISEGLIVGEKSILEPLFGRLLNSQEIEADLDIEMLTEREAEVLQLLAQGLANKQIAAALGISEHTVKFHVSAIYSKLGAASRTEAVRIGVRRGWVTL